MIYRPVLAALTLAMAACTTVAAQEDDRRMNTVVVTAQRVDTNNQQSAPNIYRRVRADFVEVAVVVQSGTRDAKERAGELETMFNRLKSTAAKTSGFHLTGGTAGRSSAPIESVQFRDVLRNYGANGQFQLTLVVDTREAETFDALMERAERFLESIKLAGRAEAYLATEQFLGIRRTDQHRDDLLADIQAEVTKLKTLFTPAILTITGLDQRVVTQPSGPLELQIFIPYKITLETGRQ